MIIDMKSAVVKNAMERWKHNYDYNKHLQINHI